VERNPAFSPAGKKTGFLSHCKRPGIIKEVITVAIKL